MICLGMGWAAGIDSGGFGHLEVTMAGSWNIRGFEATYLHQYSTPFVYGDDISSASQSLFFAGKGSMGFQAGLAYFFSRTFGLQLLAGIFNTPLDGENSPYHLDFTYTALLPPDYTAKEYQYSQDMNWPDTNGHLNQYYLSINPAFRFLEGKNVSFVLSGGLSLLNLKGLAESLGYSKFWLGGHSVLFSQLYRLEFSMGASHKIGFNAGGEISIAPLRNIRLVLAARYFLFGKTKLDVQLERILNQNEIVMQVESMEQISLILDPPAVVIPTNFPQVILGLKLVLF